MDFLRRTDILAIHARSLADLGAAHGIRDEGGLESALVAAENRHYYEGADLVGCAAAYAFHLSKAHAFVDGNKRVAAGAAEVFLVLHGASLDADDDALFDFYMAIADGS